MIALQVNGRRVELDGPIPLLAYLERLGVNPRAVAVEHNGTIIERDAYADARLDDGDVVEIVRMVGGGLQSGLLLDRLLRLGTLVPRLGAPGHLHRALVALAGQEHGVAGPRHVDGASDGGAPVDHDLIIAARSLADHAGLNVPRDLDRVLPQRIVGRDDEEVGEVGGRLAHAGPVVV